MSISAKEVKTLTGAKYKMQGETILYNRLEGRSWQFGGRVYELAGYDRGKDLVHFTTTWSVSPGTVGHKRIGIPLLVALALESGDIKDPTILF